MMNGARLSTLYPIYKGEDDPRRIVSSDKLNMDQL